MVLNCGCRNLFTAKFQKICLIPLQLRLQTEILLVQLQLWL